MYIHEYNKVKDNDNYMFRFWLQTKAPLEKNLGFQNSSRWPWTSPFGSGPMMRWYLLLCSITSLLVDGFWRANLRWTQAVCLFFFFRKNRWFFRHCDKKSDLRIFESLVSVFNDDCLLSSFVGFVFVQSPRVEATRKQEPFFSLMQCVLFLRAHRGAGMNRRYFWSYFHIPSHGKIVYLHTYMNGWFFMVFM